eukprot:s1083_g5.t1
MSRGINWARFLKLRATAEPKVKAEPKIKPEPKVKAEPKVKVEPKPDKPVLKSHLKQNKTTALQCVKKEKIACSTGGAGDDILVVIDSEGVKMEFTNCIKHVKFIAPNLQVADPPQNDLASPKTLALLSCNALFDPSSACNHWVPLLLKEQMGEKNYNEAFKRTKQQTICEESGFREQLDILEASDDPDEMTLVEMDYIRNELERILINQIMFSFL